MTDKEIEKRLRIVEFTIKSNEIEGYKYTAEEKEFLKNVAKGKIDLNEALKKYIAK